MFSDTPRPAAGTATKPATRFSREKPIPKGRSRPRRRERRGGIVSFRGRSFRLGPAFESVSNSAGIGCELDAVQVAWSRQLDYKFLLHPTRVRRKKQNPSPRQTASRTLWVTKTMVLRRDFQMRWRSP